LEDGYQLHGVVSVESNLTELTIPLILPLASLPLFLGMFIGVPLVAGELEQGTHRLAWTQGITRERWIVSKSLRLLVIRSLDNEIPVSAWIILWYSNRKYFISGLLVHYPGTTTL